MCFMPLQQYHPIADSIRPHPSSPPLHDIVRLMFSFFSGTHRIGTNEAQARILLIPRLDRDTTRELGIEVHAGASTTKRQTYLPSNIHVIPYLARGCSIDEFPQSWSQRCCLIFRYIKHLRRNRMNRWPAYMTEVPSIA